MEDRVSVGGRMTCATVRRCRGGGAAGRWVVGALLLAGLSGCQTVQNYHAGVRVRRGDELLRQEYLDSALVEFEAAAKLSPQLADPHSRMGGIYRRMGDYEKAISCFVEAIRRDPFSFEDTLNLAQLYHFTERLKEAVQAYLHAVELRPEDVDSNLSLGVCYQQLGDVDQALERFEKAIALDPDRPHAYINLGVALDTKGRYYEAIRAYKLALERDHRQPLVLVNLAHTYLNQDRLKIARGTLLKAINIDPELAPAHEALGYCLFRMRDFDGAEEAYQHALVYNPKLSRACAGLGSINMLRYLDDNARIDRRQRALEYWHRALEIEPDQPRIRKLIARYRVTTEDPETALLSAHQKP